MILLQSLKALKSLRPLYFLSQVMIFDIGGAVYGLAALAGIAEPSTGHVPGAHIAFLAAAGGEFFMLQDPLFFKFEIFSRGG